MQVGSEGDRLPSVPQVTAVLSLRSYPAAHEYVHEPPPNVMDPPAPQPISVVERCIGRGAAMAQVTAK